MAHSKAAPGAECLDLSSRMGDDFLMAASKNLLVAGSLVLAVVFALELRSISQQNREILGDLVAIRQLVETTAPPHVTTMIEADEFLGRADAPLTMIEFTDLQCPFC